MDKSVKAGTMMVVRFGVVHRHLFLFILLLSLFCPFVKINAQPSPMNNSIEEAPLHYSANDMEDFSEDLANLFEEAHLNHPVDDMEDLSVALNNLFIDDGNQEEPLNNSADDIENLSEAFANLFNDESRFENMVKALQGAFGYTKEILFKPMLIVGEGKFGYARSLLEKHDKDFPSLAKDVTVTELDHDGILRQAYDDGDPEIRGNIDYIRNKKGSVEFEIDATNIHSIYKGKRFKRIHWNFPMPWNGTDYTSGNPAAVMSGFFSSASKLQEVGDRIYVTLPNDEKDRWREGAWYDIYNASSKSGYVEVLRHKFNKRYPKYHHYVNSNASSSKTKANTENGVEHVFEKMNIGESEIKSITPPTYKCKYPYENTPCLTSKPLYVPVPKLDATDSDSDSYIDEDEERMIVGNCLFEAVARIVHGNVNVGNNAHQLRQLVVERIAQDVQLRAIVMAGAHQENIVTTDAVNTHIHHVVQYNTVEEYINLMGQDRTWGTYVELIALARVLQRPITLLPWFMRIENQAYGDAQPIYLYYNGNHYSDHPI
ncbi:MAG: Rossmann-like fold-containing protein [bacterium]